VLATLGDEYMTRIFSSLVLLLGFLQSGWAGEKNIAVVGLFKDKAVVQIGTERYILSKDHPNREGVRLISADSKGAVLEVNGQTRLYSLTGQIATQYAVPMETQVQVWPDPGGMYWSSGSINGIPVKFLVDTGATSIAMNEREAKRLGLQFRLHGQLGVVTTASGVEKVYQIRLDQVKVGDILLRGVEAVVLEGNRPEAILLGMSFLGRLELENKGKALVLKKKR
jgi:aspartyl protease family protein